MILSDKQNEYIRNSTHRWNIKTGAVRSGKSFVDSAYTVPYRIRERTGKPGLNVILGVSRETIERNVLQPMREIYTSALIGTINNRNVARICGEDVYCLGAEKTSQVAKIQGSSIKYCYGDEIAKWNKEVFQMLKSRLDKPYSCFDGSCNPENPTHWLKEFIDDDGIDLYLQKYRIFDNPFLDPEYVRNLCKEYEGTVYYDRLIEGKWKRAEGSIYRKFADNPDSFIAQIDREHISRIDIGIDFGGNGSGHAFVATAKYSDGRKQPVMSRKHMKKDFRQGIDANLLSELFLEFVEDVIKKYGKPSNAYYDNAETVLGQSIKNACEKKFPYLHVRPAVKKKINDRIEYTVQLMGAGLFSITEDCEMLSKALQEAVYNSKSMEEERLDDGSTDIDTLDAFEYSIERDFSGTHYNRVIGGI
ncbi:terminase large subunit domain-containing protein [Sellimonas intestinalis]|uniref:terminase large subunit domain-containing protein n=1 Tax=Sellimonas intestinalis TaxID=1653434 RepID=UPI0015EB4320|nr:PBSX family phage terminase large subunit [Sellimonas intestinalis]